MDGSALFLLLGEEVRCGVGIAVRGEIDGGAPLCCETGFLPSSDAGWEGFRMLCTPSALDGVESAEGDPVWVRICGKPMGPPEPCPGRLLSNGTSEGPEVTASELGAGDVVGFGLDCMGRGGLSWCDM